MLPCQNDPYLTSLTTTVTACSPSGKNWIIKLAETPFYPESGGQPSDHGTIDGNEIISLRTGLDGMVEHLLSRPLNPGAGVVAKIDWDRRFDHMQQHSGQHLLTAICKDSFGLQTTAFHLGRDKSDIELDNPSIPDATLDNIESKANELIRADLRIICREVDPQELPSLNVRSRGLPDGFKGRVRLVEMAGVDLNTCAGTHVSGTAELQALKIIGLEKIRGGTRVYFIAGGRIMKFIASVLAREKAITSMLSCGPDRHAETVMKLAEESKKISRELKTAQMELAGRIGESLKPENGIAFHHTPTADMEYLRQIADSVMNAHPGALVLVTGGDEKGAGIFLLAGGEEEVKSAGTGVTEILGGRGGGSHGIFQGKALKMENRPDAISFLLSKSGR